MLPFYIFYYAMNGQDTENSKILTNTEQLNKLQTIKIIW